MECGEIVIYRAAQDADFQIQVRIEDETVWLTQSQMAELFQTSRNNITLHIGHVFKEGELDQHSVCKNSLLTASDGKKYNTKFYNLDVIISVGYRVKSLRGTQFRIWANNVLKEYLLQGHVFNHRFEKIEKKLVEHDQKFDFLIKSKLNTDNKGDTHSPNRKLPNYLHFVYNTVLAFPARNHRFAKIGCWPLLFGYWHKCI